MLKIININKTIKSFKKKISVSSDKSLSIRWALLAAQAVGKSRAYNLLNSEDVNSALIALKKLGVEVTKNKKYCEINGKGLNSFLYNNNTVINCQNSGTLSRLICGVLAKSTKSVILKGDQSLSKRDFSRIIRPLNLFGIKTKSKKNKLPLKITGTNFLRPIEYDELIGSAQVKSCLLFCALNTPGITKIRAVPSRDHTERLFKFLKLPIKIKREKKFDIIKIKGDNQYNGFNYKIPGDISSSAFFIVLTLLSKNSKLLIKNINVNKSRTGIIDILKKMNADIKLINKKMYNGEYVADILVKSGKSLKSINCAREMNSRTIDEFLLIFLTCAKSKGISYFNHIGELRHKESDRLKFASNFLKMIGIKVKETSNSLKIYGNPKLKLNGNYKIKNYNKDHRACMMSCVAALVLGGRWKIYDSDSINTSFPQFFSKLKSLGAKIN
tara:strand:+ start:5869 stop:7194 length:1326 start_codon:yes stop_codon:yes gene_type:complete